MNAITTETAKPSLIASMAQKFNMDPKAFEQTVRATVMPANHTTEQFAALMMVAKEYDLNPLTKEIYAFPAKGGGIVPILSIDGWTNLINSNPACDGFEFDFDHDDKGNLISCTCRMYRKDRSRPVTVTEYLSECVRNTEPWKMKHRMLRHKALIQCARYAFSLSGIYDEDEGAKIAEMRDVTPAKTPPVPPMPPSPVKTDTEAHIEIADADGVIIDATVAENENAAHGVDTWPEDDNEFFTRLEDEVSVVTDMESLEEVWSNADPMARFDGKPNGDTNQGIALAIKRRAASRIRAQEAK